MFKVKKICNGPVRTNTYLVGDEQCYIIDPSDEAKNVDAVLQANFKGCKAILLTHAHFDHVGGVDYFANKYHCPVYLDLVDAELLNKEHCDQYAFSEYFREVKSPLNDIYRLEDKNIIIYPTSGHTLGSVIILFKNEGVLFTGDTLFKGSIGRTDLPFSSTKKMKESLKFIKTLNKDLIVYPGHGPSSTLNDEFLNNDYLKFI